MILLDSISKLLEPLFAVAPLNNPSWLILIPLAIILLFPLIKFQFVKTRMDHLEEKRRHRMRWLVYLSRVLIVACIAIALATPFIEITEETAGNPEITLLIDESTSMKVLDTSFVDSFRAALEDRVPMRTRTIGSDGAIGDAILDNLEPGRHVLLVSDGNVPSGTSLEDVAFYAINELDASVSAIKLEEANEDASVFITGPDKVVAGTSNTYVVHITSTNDKPVPVVVKIDGQSVIEKLTSDRILSFEKELGIGDHKIEATIGGSDHFTNNNRFYKTVSVLEKPRILLLSEKDSPVESILDELYTVDKKTRAPTDLSPYYAIVTNDVGKNAFGDVNNIHEFLLDETGGYYGGGMVVLGGFNSFDRGGYQNAPIESLLPVRVGKGEQKKGDDNIVIILDMSGGTTGVRYEKVCDAAGNCDLQEVKDKASALDIIKAQAVNLISSEQNIIATNKVAVIAFGAQGTLSEAEHLAGKQYEATDTVKIIEPLDYLYNNQNKLKEKIPRLIGGGPSEIGLALQGAYDILKTKQGQSNYVLILTDGNVAPSIQQEAMIAVENLQRRGVKVFTYGVGRNEQNIMGDFLKAVATAGDGLFAGPVYSTRDVRPAQISIQWGNPDAKGFGDEFGLIPFSLTHFITRGLELTAVLNGYNQVTPKSNAKMLVTTDFGHPALTVMNYGNGRVAALTVFTGGGLGPLLNAENSILITRTVNWAIGDPQRKQDFYVDIQDARINEQTKATIRTDETLSAPDVDLIKDGDRYTAFFTPDRLGFSTFFGAVYATNYEREYQEVGMNPILNQTVSLTNGKIFSPEDIDEIVAHVSELSKRTVVERQALRWPFISLALIIFLIEIFIRRINQYKKD